NAVVAVVFERADGGGGIRFHQMAVAEKHTARHFFIEAEHGAQWRRNIADASIACIEPLPPARSNQRACSQRNKSTACAARNFLFGSEFIIRHALAPPRLFLSRAARFQRGRSR